MDVEGTMQFILEHQAKHEARLGLVDEQMEAIRTLIQQGMRYVLQAQENGRETDKRISALVVAQQETEQKVAATAVAEKLLNERMAELSAAQKATEKSLKAFLDSQLGKNGH